MARGSGASPLGAAASRTIGFQSNAVALRGREARGLSAWPAEVVDKVMNVEADRHVIAAVDLTRRFDDADAVHALSLQIHRGEVFGILGHNGAGKTTFLRLVNGLLRPTSGTITTFGCPSYETGFGVRARTGVVTESTSLDDFLTIRESLVAYGTMAGLPSRRIHAHVHQILEIFDLSDIADRQVRELSAGMRQRAAVARGLVHDPELLLLDEPTANMDPIAARQVRHVVADLARQAGRTVVLSTHNLAEAQDICDRIAVLRKGRLQALGTMAELSSLLTRGAATVTLVTGPGQGTKAIEVATAYGQATMDGAPDVVTLHGADVERIPALIVDLVRADVAVRGVAEAAPTLEDVYLALHLQSDGA
jgi:ABC-2 type transport system ATP-binding protein